MLMCESVKSRFIETDQSFDQLKNNRTFFSSTFKLKKIKWRIFLDKTSFEGDMSFLSFFTCEGFYITFVKQQNDHNSPGWTLIMKTSALSFKVEENKVPLFFCIRHHLRELWAFCHFLTCQGFKVPLRIDRIAITHQDELWLWFFFIFTT